MQFYIGKNGSENEWIHLFLNQNLMKLKFPSKNKKIFNDIIVFDKEINCNALSIYFYVNNTDERKILDNLCVKNQNVIIFYKYKIENKNEFNYKLINIGKLQSYNDRYNSYKINFIYKNCN